MVGRGWENVGVWIRKREETKTIREQDSEHKDRRTHAARRKTNPSNNTTPTTTYSVHRRRDIQVTQNKHMTHTHIRGQGKRRGTEKRAVHRSGLA